MKKLFFTVLIFAGVFSFIACSDDDDNKQITFEEFVSEQPRAKEFLTKHFASANESFNPADIHRIEVDKDGSYEVKFVNGIEIDFYASGEWEKIDMNGNPLPQSVAALLPIKAIDYINSNYPNNLIEEVERKGTDRIEIEIKPSDIDILFDLNGNVQNDPGTGGSTKPETGLKVTDLPLGAQDFLAAHLKGIAVVEIEKDKDEFEVELQGYDVEFDLDGNFKSIDAETPNSVPESIFRDAKAVANGKLILDYITTNHSGQRIGELSKFPSYFTGDYKDGYKVELKGTPELDVIFNKDGKHLETYID